MVRATASRCLAALTLTVGVAACGGEDTMSVSEYRAEAKKVCVAADKETAQIKQPTKATAEAIADYFQRLLAANDRTTKRFEALDPPEKLKQAHADALKANQGAIAEVQRIVKELEGGTEPREVLSSAQSRLQTLSRESGDAAKRLGVPECAEQ